LISLLTIIAAFTEKLNLSFNFLSDQSIDESVPLIDVGLDSLVAVDIRTWFLQELKVDIPVLKILSGASAGELVSIAIEKLPQEFLPKFTASSTHESPTTRENETIVVTPASLRSK
jgi:hybrid polyketide synthase/nonribosomal peptide synthetase ACE1